MMNDSEFSFLNAAVYFFFQMILKFPPFDWPIYLSTSQTNDGCVDPDPKHARGETSTVLV